MKSGWSATCLNSDYISTKKCFNFVFCLFLVRKILDFLSKHFGRKMLFSVWYKFKKKCIFTTASLALLIKTVFNVIDLFNKIENTVFVILWQITFYLVCYFRFVKSTNIGISKWAINYFCDKSKWVNLCFTVKKPNTA